MVRPRHKPGETATKWLGDLDSRVRATSPSLCTAAHNHRPQIPPNTAAFLKNGATTPRTRGDRDKVAVHAVSCEPVSRFPVYQANIREFIANLVLVWHRIPLQKGCFS